MRKKEECLTKFCTHKIIVCGNESQMQEEALAQIDDELSEEVVTDRPNRRGSTVSPWFFS